MTTNEIGTVIGMVCDKVGLAVDRVQPLAEEVVRQYSQKEMLYTMECVMFAVLFAVMAIIGGVLCKKSTGSEDYQEGMLIAGVATLAFGAMLACIVADTAFSHYGNAISPLCGLIGK